VIYRNVDKQKTSFLKTTGFDETIISDFNKFDIKLCISLKILAYNQEPTKLASSFLL